ncbi:MAG: TonB-dependent receptor [Myxococcales bacterium]|nr:TonB-dependent receptor [Myxococcales bacterium]
MAVAIQLVLSGAVLAPPDVRAYVGVQAVAPAGWPASAGAPPGAEPDPKASPAMPAPAAAEPVPEDSEIEPVREDSPTPAPRRVPGVPANGGLERDVRYIEVTTSLLGRSTRLDVQRHAGGRAILDIKESQAQGAASVAEALDKVPGVRAVEGVSGTGTASTKLNVAVRGASPRLAEQATVMLDEVPIAPAPYGAPSLSLFPLSLFQIARVDTVRGGSSVRFGPWTSGGVFNMVSHPIPVNPTVSVAGQVDQFGDAGVAGSYGGTHRKIGMFFEYAPRFGRTYREHSEFLSHAGIVKLHFPISRRVALESNTHLFWERTNLPGGITWTQFNEGDRYQSNRPHDRFDGHREASNLKLKVTPRADHEVQVIGFYSHTFRRNLVASNEDTNLSAAPMHLRSLPRVYDVVGVEPRYALRLRHKQLFQDLSFGVRGVFETARLRDYWLTPIDSNQPLGDVRACPRGSEVADPSQAARRCLDGRTGGYSLYAEDKLYLLDTALVITGGLRGEIMRQRFYNLLDGETLPAQVIGGVLPALSVWYGGDHVAGYAGYGRSFGAPSYYAATLGNQSMPKPGLGFITPERAELLELGVKLMDLGGVYATADGFYKYFKTLRDEGTDGVDILPYAHVWGVELDVEWEPGEVWEAVEGLSFDAGYAYNGSWVRGPNFAGHKMPWYPVHEAWGGGQYEFPWGLRFGTHVDYTGAQFSDYYNYSRYDRETGEIGVMPAYTLMSANVGMRTALPRGWRVEFTVGAKNLLGQVWYTRSDDLNGGIMAMRPRTFYLNLAIAHEWVRTREAEQARARRNAQRPDRRQWTATAKRNGRFMQRVWGGMLGAWM